MDRHLVSLPDLVQWGVAGGLALLLVKAGLNALARRKQNRLRRGKSRRCAQCGILEEIAPGDSKFGTCSLCGGVTTRGRSRKLG